VPRYIQDVLSFYYKVSTQWNVGFGGRIGLNYQSVKDVADIFGFDINDFTMTVLQEIEHFILHRESTRSTKQ